jgi:hypothetical protein
MEMIEFGTVEVKNTKLTFKKYLRKIINNKYLINGEETY